MLVHFSRREYRCQSGLHRPDCGGSTPPSCRVRVASIAAMQRSLKPQSTGQHRGDPPSFALSQRPVGSERRMPSIVSCEGGLLLTWLRATAGRPPSSLAESYGWHTFSPMWLSSDSSSFV